MDANILKAKMIALRGYKGSIICDEVRLGNSYGSGGLFADLYEITKDGKIIIYEIKSSKSDFNTDKKFHKYLDYCDLFYFVADSETIQHIKSMVDKSIGLYEVKENWNIPICIRRSKRNKNFIHLINEEDHQITILKKIMYRYYKINYKIAKKNK